MADLAGRTSPVIINTTGNSAPPTADRLAQVIGWLTFSVGLPAIGLAIYILTHQSAGDRKIPIHIFSLLISDALSFFGRPQAGGGLTVTSADTATLIFYFGMVSNVTFMLCIAQERHLLVAYPQCHGFNSSLRRSALVSLVIWAIPFAVVALAGLGYFFWFSVALLGPSPLFLFFTVDSWRALVCCPPSPATPERRRMAWGLAVILAQYSLLYLPFILSILLESLEAEVPYLGLVSHLLLYLGPLVDPLMYILMTQSPRQVLEALPCWKKTPPTVHTVAETVETRL